MDETKDLFSDACTENGATSIYSLFSGGHDSVCATHLASKHPSFKGVLHINTGIGIEATREYVRYICKKFGWHLWEYKAAECLRADGGSAPQVYSDICKKYGFPGSNELGHRMMYSKLKERPLRQFEREVARSDKLWIYASGCRQQESVRRMGNGSPIQKRGRSIWISGIWDWSKGDVEQYLRDEQIPRNEVVDKLHKSGECLCGAFAKAGEFDELAYWYPEVAAKIKTLQAEVNAEGFPWGWDGSPPAWWNEKKAGQTFLLDYDNPASMCWSCGKSQ